MTKPRKSHSPSPESAPSADFEDALRIVQKMLVGGSATADFANTVHLSGTQSKKARHPRLDELSKLVFNIAKANPKITAKRLLTELRTHVGKGVIEEITPDDFIVWKTLAGRLEKGPISGLDDRLSRAKARLKKNSR